MTLDYLKELQEALAEEKSNIMKNFDFWLDVAMPTLIIMILSNLVLLILSISLWLFSNIVN